MAEHGSALTTAEAKTRGSRPSATYGSTRLCQQRGHMESSKGPTSILRSRVQTASRVTKATAAWRAGR
jgi:hypothetical protein